MVPLYAKAAAARNIRIYLLFWAGATAITAPFIPGGPDLPMTLVDAVVVGLPLGLILFAAYRILRFAFTN